MAKTSRASTRSSARKPARSRPRPAARRTAATPARATATPAREAAQTPAPVRKPTYQEAVMLYERGLQALQRRDFATAADTLRAVIERYPEERELLERARLYLKVCERELTPREPAPRTSEERVYAATVALNAGDESAALQHLQNALTENRRSDHAHYMMAVVRARRGETSAALEHLRQAVALNGDNRSLARQDPDLDVLRSLDDFRAVLEPPAAASTASRGSSPRTRRRR